MIGRTALLGLLLLAAACTDQVLFADTGDGGGPSSPNNRDAATPTTGDAACAEKWVKPVYTARTAQIIILFDRSMSMQYAFYGSTRTEAAQTALLDAIEDYQYKVKFGFEQFPADSFDKEEYADCQRGLCCAGPIDVVPQYSAYRAIKGPLLCSDPLSYPCPTASYDSPSSAALLQARDYFRTYPTSDERHLLLVTGAEPTCNTGAGGEACRSALDAVAELGNKGVRVVVLAVGYQPGQGSCLVRIGDSGTNTLYAPTSVNELNNKVRDFVAAVARTGCTLDATDVVPSQAQLSVTIGATDVDQDANNGWSFAKANRATLVLSGSACDQYLRSQSNKLYVSYTCPSCGGSNTCQW